MKVGRSKGWRNKRRDWAYNKLKIQMTKGCSIPKYYPLTPEQVQAKGVATKPKNRSDCAREIGHIWKEFYFYESTASPGGVLPSRRQEGPSSRSHVVTFRVQTKREGLAVLFHVSHTWSASHSHVRHEVLPLLPAILLGQLLGGHHLRAVACPGLGKMRHTARQWLPWTLLPPALLFWPPPLP